MYVPCEVFVLLFQKNCFYELHFFCQPGVCDQENKCVLIFKKEKKGKSCFYFYFAVCFVLVFSMLCYPEVVINF